MSLTEGVGSRSMFPCLGFPRRPCLCMERPRPLSGATWLDPHPSSSFVPGHLPGYPISGPLGLGKQIAVFRAVSMAAQDLVKPMKAAGGLFMEKFGGKKKVPWIPMNPADQSRSSLGRNPDRGKQRKQPENPPQRRRPRTASGGRTATWDLRGRESSPSQRGEGTGWRRCHRMALSRYLQGRVQ